MKPRQVLVYVLVCLGLLWVVYPRFVDDVQEDSETELPLVTEVVLGTIPPTEEQIPTAAFPDESRITETFSQDELAIVEYIEEPASEFADAFIQFQFEGYDDGVPLSDGITYAVSEGESLNLEIVRCIWTPVDNLMYIGVYNSETETGYAYAYVDGNAQLAVSFDDQPAGEYVVYVKNMGDRMITDGTLRYRVS